MSTSTYLVAVLAGGSAARVPLAPRPGDLPRFAGLEVEAPGERTAAAQAYVLGVGWRRATRLRQRGAPGDAVRAETDVGSLVGSLIELGRVRWPGGGSGGCSLESWGFWLPPGGGAPGRGEALILVSRRVGGPCRGRPMPPFWGSPN